jgi:hypothetical protein
MEASMIHGAQLKRRVSSTMQTVRTSSPETCELLCEVIVDGLSIAGRTIELAERDLSIVLQVPLFARLDWATILLTQHDGSTVEAAGRVTRQEQIGVGEVLVVIRLVDLPIKVTTLPPENHSLTVPLQVDCAAEQHFQTTKLLDWVRILAGSSVVPNQDRRLIPRLTIHTACTMLTKDRLRAGLTRDVSYMGFSVQFSDFAPDYLGSALFCIKFVKLKATPIGLTDQGTYTVVRFRVDSIQEGESRWRDMHYSCWQHLS